MSLATVYAPYRFPSFRNGLWLHDDATTLARDHPGTLAGGNDITFLNGIVRKRVGFDPLGSALPGTIQRVFDYFQPTLTQHTLALGTAGAWEWSDTTQTWTQRATLAGNLVTVPSVTVFNSVLIVANGADPLYSWDGVSASFTALTGSPPQTARFVLGYKNHLLAGYPTIAGTVYPFRVMWSDFNNQNQWASGDAAIVDLLDAMDPLVAPATFGEWGILGRRFSILNVVPADAPAFYQFQKTVDKAGIVAAGSVQVVPQGMYYLSDDDLYVYNSISSAGIGTALRNVLAEGTPAFSSLGTAVSTLDLDHGEYWLAIPSTPTSASPDLIVVHSYKDGYMTQHRKAATALGGRLSAGSQTWGQPPLTGAWSVVLGETWLQLMRGTGLPLMALANQGQVYLQSPLLSDGGAAITSTIVTALTDMDQPGIKRLARILLTFAFQASGTIQVYVLSSDIGDLATATSTGPYPVTLGGQTLAWVDVDDAPAARFFAVKIVHSVANVDIGLKEIALFARRRGLWV